MARLNTSAATDYRYVDGLESVTLSSDTASITVEHANRGQLLAGATMRGTGIGLNQLSGAEAGVEVWLLPVGEVTGAITLPAPGMHILDADGVLHVIVSVQKMQLSRMWQCTTRQGMN